MTDLVTASSRWAATCNFNRTEYAVGKLSPLGLLGVMASCFTIDRINLRGVYRENIQGYFTQSVGVHIYIDPLSGSCSPGLQNVLNYSTLGGRAFGSYTAPNPNHMCTATNESTTNV